MWRALPDRDTAAAHPRRSDRRRAPQIHSARKAPLSPRRSPCRSVGDPASAEWLRASVPRSYRLANRPAPSPEIPAGFHTPLCGSESRQPAFPLSPAHRAGCARAVVRSAIGSPFGSPPGALPLRPVCGLPQLSRSGQPHLVMQCRPDTCLIAGARNWHPLPVSKVWVSKARFVPVREWL
jgi:hypothetical protein